MNTQPTIEERVDYLYKNNGLEFSKVKRIEIEKNVFQDFVTVEEFRDALQAHEKQVREEIEDRFSFLSTQKGASEKIYDIEVRDICKAYQIVMKDLQALKSLQGNKE